MRTQVAAKGVTDREFRIWGRVIEILDDQDSIRVNVLTSTGRGNAFKGTLQHRDMKLVEAVWSLRNDVVAIYPASYHSNSFIWTV